MVVEEKEEEKEEEKVVAFVSIEAQQAEIHCRGSLQDQAYAEERMRHRGGLTVYVFTPHRLKNRSVL